MVAERVYDSLMRRLVSATVAAFALFAWIAIPAATGQINGVPASVTSIGFGGHATPGVLASITSLGPHGFQSRSPFFNEPVCCINPLFPVNSNPPLFSHHHHSGSNFPVTVPFYSVPYSPVIVVQQPAEDESTEAEEEYRGGPTIFDRRGPGRSNPYEPSRPADDRYREPARREGREVESEPEPIKAEAAPAAEQPETVLVFKDGHQLEVQNYAVVGSMLYDFTAGRRRKIALSELDLSATAKQNDDRGIDFQVPAGSETN
jgi:hypothetical protein